MVLNISKDLIPNASPERNSTEDQRTGTRNVPLFSKSWPTVFREYVAISHLSRNVSINLIRKSCSIILTYGIKLGN